MIINYKEHGFEIRARILPEACTACPFYLYSISCDEAECFLTGSDIPTDGPQDEGRAPDCPIKAFEGLGEWTPCSERLPKKEEATYLICTEDGYMCSCRWTNDIYGLGSNEWSEWGWHILDKPQHTKVVAWAEKKPWKGADDEHDQ